MNKVASPTSAGRWITGRVTRESARVRLIGLPQAGGGAGAFRSWRRHLPEWLELAPVELPGRGTREAEPLPERFEDLIEALLAGTRAERDMPYALFGHSFGGVLAYELALRAETAPLCLIVSASRAPHLPAERRMSAAAEPELLRWLTETGGLPPELLEFPDFLRQLLPPIRRDMAFAEDYLVAEPTPVACPLYAFAGADDRVVTAEQVAGWSGCTTAAFRRTVFPGGHSFPSTGPAALVAAVADAVGATR
ncbi:thioesterase II family protein [Actinoplanes philippinensis]|uniref:thioesterase II family protein n=1 Tax=Actinoplanes philippinensis TaxID=35752 RepID=UPI0033D10BD8